MLASDSRFSGAFWDYPRLDPLDRQVIVSYLEGLQADVISEITGISAGNIPMKIHRIKSVLGRRFNQGANHGK